MIRIHVSGWARRELRQALGWYRERSPRAAKQLLLDYEKALSLVSVYPRSNRIWIHGTRRQLLSRFPFAVVYLLERTGAAVVAFAGLKQKPGYWRKRGKHK